MAARVTGCWLTSKAESLEKCSKERKTREELGSFQPKILAMKGLYFYFIWGYLVKNKIWHPAIPLVSKKCLLGRCCCCPSSRKLLFSARSRMSGNVLCNKTIAMALPVNMSVPEGEVSWGSTLRQRSTGRLLTADEGGRMSLSQGWAPSSFVSPIQNDPTQTLTPYTH